MKRNPALNYKWPMREGYTLRQRKRCKISLVHRGAAAVDVKAYVLGQRVDARDENHGLAERRVLELEVSTGQTNFATATADTEPVSVGDKVTYLSRPYFVESVMMKDAHGRIYQLSCVEDKQVSDGI